MTHFSYAPVIICPIPALILLNGALPILTMIRSTFIIASAHLLLPQHSTYKIAQSENLWLTV